MVHASDVAAGSGHLQGSKRSAASASAHRVVQKKGRSNQVPRFDSAPHPVHTRCTNRHSKAILPGSNPILAHSSGTEQSPPRPPLHASVGWVWA